MRTIHAPRASFDAATSTATIPVVIAPTPLMIARRRQPDTSFRSRRQRRTMPDWLRVKATNTPMVYSGIRLVTLPSKYQIRRLAITASTTIP